MEKNIAFFKRTEKNIAFFKRTEKNGTFRTEKNAGPNPGQNWVSTDGISILKESGFTQR